MSWVRTDDGEVLDDRIGDLTDREYRARHALLQYLAREHNETGIFHESRANRAVFSTQKGARTLTRAHLSTLISLGLVERLEALEDDYLESLGIERPEGPGWLRPSRWERYNPPRDATNAERQRRYRNAVTNAVTNAPEDRNDNDPSRAGAPAFPSRTDPKTTTEEQEQPQDLEVQTQSQNPPPLIARPPAREELADPHYLAPLDFNGALEAAELARLAQTAAGGLELAREEQPR